MSAGTGLIFHGTGFYITDYGKDGKKEQKRHIHKDIDAKKDFMAESTPGDSSSPSEPAAAGVATATKPAETRRRKARTGGDGAPGTSPASKPPAAAATSSKASE
jgi:hypothetical protein